MISVRQTIIDDNAVKHLISDRTRLLKILHESRDALADAERNLALFRVNGIRDYKERLNDIEAEVAYEIAMSPNYKNESQRKAAAQKELTKHEEYSEIKKKLIEAEQNQVNLEMKISEAKASVETARYALATWQSNMAVVAGLSAEQTEMRHTTEAIVSIPQNGSSKL